MRELILAAAACFVLFVFVVVLYRSKRVERFLVQRALNRMIQQVAEERHKRLKAEPDYGWGRKQKA